MKEEIKALRVKIDGLAQLTRSLYLTKGELKNPNNWILYHAKETEKTYDSLILAKAWLGKILGLEKSNLKPIEGLNDLIEDSPYVNDGQRKTIEDIEPTADVAKIVPGLREPFAGNNNKEVQMFVDTWELNGRPMNDYDAMSHIEKVDWLREEIKVLLQELDAIKFRFDDSNELLSQKKFSIQSTCSAYSYKHLSEARFWLGFELQRIRENDNTRNS